MRRPLIALTVLALALVTVRAAAGAIGITVSPTSASTSTTLSGVDESASFDVTATVSGGGNSGWNITAWAPQPTASGRSLPKLEVSSTPSAAACTGNKCVQPSPTGISWPVSLGTTSGGAVKVYNAAAATGTGTVAITIPFGVTVPANTYSGTYTTTITFTISGSGP